MDERKPLCEEDIQLAVQKMKRGQSKDIDVVRFLSVLKSEASRLVDMSDSAQYYRTPVLEVDFRELERNMASVGYLINTYKKYKNS